MINDPLITISRLCPDMDAVHVSAIITAIEIAVHGSIVAAFLARMIEYEAEGRPIVGTRAQALGHQLHRANNVVRAQQSAPLVRFR